jgi:hypothetical protein
LNPEAKPAPDILDWARPEPWHSWLRGQSLGKMAAAEVAGRLRARFRALRAFHAARPIATGAYYTHGIEPLTRQRWRELVHECFLSHTDDAIVAAAIIRASDVQFELVREGRVHFCCDRRLLEERDGYNLLFGSLSLLAVAIQIDKECKTDFKSLLRHRGNPTVFVCEIPLTSIQDDVLTHLVLRVDEEHSSRTYRAAPLPFGFHFSISSALPPAAIIAHYSPRRVVDSVYGKHIAM